MTAEDRREAASLLLDLALDERLTRAEVETIRAVLVEQDGQIARALDVGERAVTMLEGTAERIASWCEATARRHRHEAIDVLHRNRTRQHALASGLHGRAAALDDLAARLRDGRLS